MATVCLFNNLVRGDPLMSTENALYNPPADFVAKAKVSGMDAYHAMCQAA